MSIDNFEDIVLSDSNGSDQSYFLSDQSNNNVLTPGGQRSSITVLQIGVLGLGSRLVGEDRNKKILKTAEKISQIAEVKRKNSYWFAVSLQFAQLQCNYPQIYDLEETDNYQGYTLFKLSITTKVDTPAPIYFTFFDQFRNFTQIQVSIDKKDRKRPRTSATHLDLATTHPLPPVASPADWNATQSVNKILLVPDQYNDILQETNLLAVELGFNRVLDESTVNATLWSLKRKLTRYVLVAVYGALKTIIPIQEMLQYASEVMILVPTKDGLEVVSISKISTKKRALELHVLEKLQDFFSETDADISTLPKITSDFLGAVLHELQQLKFSAAFTPRLNDELGQASFVRFLCMWFTDESVTCDKNIYLCFQYLELAHSPEQLTNLTTQALHGVARSEVHSYGSINVYVSGPPALLFLVSLQKHHLVQQLLPFGLRSITLLSKKDVIKHMKAPRNKELKTALWSLLQRMERNQVPYAINAPPIIHTLLDELAAFTGPTKQTPLHQAIFDLTCGNYELVISALDKLISETPEDPSLYVYLLFAHYCQSSLHQLATKLATQFQLTFNSEETTTVSRAVLLISGQQYAAANDILTAALTKFAASDHILALTSLTSLFQHKFEAATDLASQISPHNQQFAALLKNNIAFEQKFRQGMDFFRIDDPKALQYFKEALQINSNMSKVLVMISRALDTFEFRWLRAASWQEIIGNCSVSLSLQPLVNGIKYLVNQQYKQAAQVNINSADVWQNYFKCIATSYFDCSASLEICNQCIATDPSIYNFYITKGFLCSQLETGLEDECYDKALQLTQDAVVAWNNKGWVFNSKKDYESAEEMLDIGLAFNPNSNMLRISKAKIFKRAGKYDEARKLFEQIGPMGDADAIEDYAILLEITGDLDQCLLMLQSYLPYLQNSTEVHTELAVTHLLKSNYDEALESATAALQVSPLNARAMSVKAKVLHEKGEDEEALKVINAAINIEPDHIYYWDTKLLILDELEDKDQQIVSCCDEILKLEPIRPDALANKALALINLDKFQEAYETCEILVTQEDDSVVSWIMLALAATASERLDRAKFALEKGKSLDSTDKWLESIKSVEDLVNSLQAKLSGQGQEDTSYKAVVQKDYIQEEDDELCVFKGEEVLVLNDNGAWAYVSNSSEVKGLVPVECLEKIKLEKQPQNSRITALTRMMSRLVIKPANTKLVF